MSASKLTPKQQRFVEEYLVDLNATQAAIRAGYSSRTASVIAHENLRKPEVASAVQAGRLARSERTEITADRVLEEISRLAFANIADLFDWEAGRASFVPKADLTREQMSVIAEISSETDRVGELSTTKLKLKTYDKLGALRDLGKHLGLFVERHEHTGKDGGPIETRDASLDELSSDELAAMALRLARSER